MSAKDRPEFIDRPSSWVGADLRANPAGWICELGPADIAELEHAAEHYLQLGRDVVRLDGANGHQLAGGDAGGVDGLVAVGQHRAEAPVQRDEVEGRRRPSGDGRAAAADRTAATATPITRWVVRVANATTSSAVAMSTSRRLPP